MQSFYGSLSVRDHPGKEESPQTIHDQFSKSLYGLVE